MQDLFNDYIIHFDEERFRDVLSMVCNCLPECDYYFYNTQFSNVPLYNMNDIILDVHYMGQTSFRYKTDIVITRMDLLGKFTSATGETTKNTSARANTLRSAVTECIPCICHPREGQMNPRRIEFLLYSGRSLFSFLFCKKGKLELYLQLA